ncbi:MAG: YfiR family protein [Capsulimonadaceae bacterium]|nr:YfiR family protein [Capsulimonadaceae bacterium]
MAEETDDGYSVRGNAMRALGARPRAALFRVCRKSSRRYRAEAFFAKWGACLIHGLAIAAIFGVLSVAAAAAPAPEYLVKAAFLYNFGKFVSYPQISASGDNVAFSIGVLGDDPFGAALDQTVQGKTIDDHKIVIRRSSNLDDLKTCQILFIGSSHKRDFAAILARLKGDNVLTVGECDGFATQGGMINFFIEENKVRFEINPRAAERANLQISAQLLRLGRVVADEQSANGS